jgi:hypothetical protein
LGEGVGGVVQAIALEGTNVYVGGQFSTAGALTANQIARWNGSQWLALGGGLGGGNAPAVQAIAVNGEEVYAGGNFTTAGGTGATNVALWNGRAWSGLGSGVGGFPHAAVTALALSHHGLWVGGDFFTAGSRPAAGLSVWHALTLARPRIVDLGLASAGCRIEFTTLADLPYEVEVSHDLSSTNWTVLAEDLRGSGGIVTVTDPAATHSRAGFYRIGLPP